jgi:integrase
MGKKHIPGLRKLGNVWHIDKRVNGSRLCESTGTSNFEEAERYLVRRMESIRQATVYGIRPKRIFRDAAIKFMLENQHKRSIRVDAWCLKTLDPYIGDMSLESVHMGSLQHYIRQRQKEGVKTKTINLSLQVVRHLLNLAASVWMDEHGLTWLASPPKIKLLPETDKRKPYPLSWEEQNRLFEALPNHLQEMALFAVNTGCRDREVCGLRWEWEVKVPINKIGSVFIIPGERIKNGEDRLVVLNKIALGVIERQRGKHSEYVFVYRNKPIYRMLNHGWRKAREKTNLPVRVHDLKHTCGRRLRAAGVSFEDRQDLLGHKSARITTHYSSAELLNLWEAVNKICDEQSAPALILLRLVKNLGHEKLTKPVLSGVAKAS